MYRIAIVALLAVSTWGHDSSDDASLLQASAVSKKKGVGSTAIKALGKPLGALRRLTRRRKSAKEANPAETMLAAAGRTKYELADRAEEEAGAAQTGESLTDEETAQRAEAKARSKAFAAASGTLLDIIASQAWAGEKLMNLGDRAPLKDFGSRRLQLDRVKTAQSLDQELQRMHLLTKRLSKVATAELARRSGGEAPEGTPPLDVAAMVKYLSRQKLADDQAPIFESFVMQAWRDRHREATGRQAVEAGEWPADLAEAVYLGAGKDHVYKNSVNGDNEHKDYFNLLLLERTDALDRLALARKTNSSGFDWKEGGRLGRDWEVATSARSLQDVEGEPIASSHPSCEKKPISGFEASGMFFKVTDANRQPNPRAFCYNHPQAASTRMTAVSQQTVVQECLERNHLSKFARIYYEQQVKANLGDIEASFCFLEGHCDNQVLHENATAADGERACDMKYGAKSWREMGLRDGSEKAWWQYGLMTKDKGLKDAWPSKYFGMLSCAMGHFHCDVHMCKETFCANPYFRKHYADIRQRIESGEVSHPPVKSALKELHDQAEGLASHWSEEQILKTVRSAQAAQEAAQVVR